ncbi:hypothetical protein ABPG72_004742 [Tetrahymena utriculariae]
MKVFDKNESKRKCVEVFSQDQQGEMFELIIEHSQISKQIARKEYILNVLNSYFIDDYMIFYVIEYEDFDVSTKNLKKIFNLTQFDQLDIELKQNLDNIYEYLKLAISPISNYQQTNLQMDISQQGYFTFQKFNEQYITKLNVIDPHLFQLSTKHKLLPINQELTDINIDQEKLFKFPNNLVQKQKLFIESIQQNYPRLIEKFQELILHIAQDESCSYSLLKVNETAENIYLLKITDKNEKTLIQIQRYESYDEGKSQIQKYLLQKKELDEYQISANADFELKNLTQDTVYKSIELNQRFQQQIFNISNDNIEDLTCTVFLNVKLLEFMNNQFDINNLKEALIIKELIFYLEPINREQNQLDRLNKSICYCNYNYKNLIVSSDQMYNTNQHMQTNQEDQPYCISHESNQLATKLANKFIKLKRLHIVFCFCCNVQQYMDKTLDYFSLARNQNLIYLEITIVDEKSQIEIFKQLKQNKNQINTLVIKDKNDYNQSFKVSKVLKKLKYIVQLKPIGGFLLN